MNKINRRKFMIAAAQGAGGLGFIAGCNKRSIIGDDIRSPSAPKGLDGYVIFENTLKKAVLKWKAHDLTDITGAPSETTISGYNIFCDDKKLNATLITTTSFKDDKGPDGNGLVEGTRYYYDITAVDANGNESPHSNPVRVKVSPPSKIYKVTRDDVVTGTTINPDIVKTMVHAGVMALTGKSTVAEAYESLFPSLSTATKIGIKINCLAGSGLCTHPAVVAALVDGLSQMLNATFPHYNIIVFDDRMESLMKSAGFPLKNNPGDYRVVSSFFKTPENWGQTYLISGSSQRISRVVEDVDHIINVPVLKDHSNAGITFALKNFYGIVDNPGEMHDQKPQKTWCDPYVAGVYKLAAAKTKMIVGDALFGAHKGGPSTAATFTPKTILIGADPVAMDMYALKMINDERTAKGMYEITTEPDPANPTRADARHILTASSGSYELGTINKEIIEVQS